MITKINEIKNLGIFKDYRMPKDGLNFERFNLIYGWNGSGKTTLTKLFTAFGSGKLEDFLDLKYKFMDGDETYIQGNPYDRKIRVFNKTYIDDNVYTKSGESVPIFILGKENIELNKQIENDEKTLADKKAKKKETEKARKLKEKEKNGIFSTVASNSSISMYGVPSKEYDKRHAEKDFVEMGGKKTLHDKEFKRHKDNLSQETKATLKRVDISPIEVFDNTVREAKSLLSKTVKTEVIERLKEHRDISIWVERGITVHMDNSSANCEFCDQLLPKDRITKLLTYFNPADQALKKDIESCVTELEKRRGSIYGLETPEVGNFYDEFTDKYKKLRCDIKDNKKILVKHIVSLVKKLEDKKQSTTVQLPLKTSIDAHPLAQSITELNELIDDCNDKTENFSSSHDDSKKAIKYHFLSKKHDPITKLIEEIKELDIDIKHHDVAIKDLQALIDKNKGKISGKHIACEEINEQLKYFLGRGEITFEALDECEGYKIKRNGTVAKNLSESEKSAIAFVYFTVALNGQDFNIKEGIVVIDDPISSFDSNSITQAFSFLKNSVWKAHQVFILTHNFDFLRLLIPWLNSMHAGFFMIKDKRGSNGRKASLGVLDKLLKDYKSEYQYLFKLLYEFNKSEWEGDLTTAYPYPNFARKVLEFFLMIMSPDDSKMLDKLKKVDFDENKKDAIYRFTNHYSHMTGDGFEPSRLKECRNIVGYLLKMIEARLPEHYVVLKKLANEEHKDGKSKSKR